MSKPRRYVGGPGEALCCCEYDNMNGEKSHVLAACCDCEAVDWMCDRCLTCQRIPEDVYDRACLTISDRLRIPSCAGGGAVRINPDIVIPVVCVALFLILATIHYVMTAICLTILPSVVLCQYRIWMRRKNKPRTKVFYMWGLVSTWIMFIVFFYIAIITRKVALSDLIFLLTIYVAMMVALVHARKEPGFIPLPPPEPKKSPTRTRQERINRNVEKASALLWNKPNPSVESNGDSRDLSQHMHKSSDDAPNQGVTTAEAIKSLSPVGALLVDNFHFKEEDVMTAIDMRLEDEEEKRYASDFMAIEDVTWVDSRPIEEGHLITWCVSCKVDRPPRSGHCPVCERCVLGRDHHCVWIDNCVGAHNHRAFMSAVLLFVTGGFYGAYIAIYTICPVSNSSNSFWSLPGECIGVYHKFMDTFAFVCTCYALVACCGILFICLNQLVFIVQNITSQEAHMASRRGWTRFCFFAHNNVHNRGVIRNLIAFFSGRRKHQHTYSIVA